MYRVQVIHLQVPPLRERRDDIALLVEHFAAQRGRTIRLTPDARQALEQYDWPGNVRELHNVVEHVLCLAAGDEIDADDLPFKLRAAASKPSLEEDRGHVADELYSGLVMGRYRFWEKVHPMFLKRDITRQDVRELVQRGLATCGSHRELLKLFGMPAEDYKRFLNFLTTHRCQVKTLPFRGAPHDLARVPPGRAESMTGHKY